MSRGTDDRRAGARGYFDFHGVDYGSPGAAARAAADVRLAELKALRASGTMHVRFGEREIWFKSDAELVAAIAALEAELNPQRPRNVMVRPTTQKGW